MRLAPLWYLQHYSGIEQVWNWFQNRRHAQKAKIDKLKAVGSSVETPPVAPKPVPAPVAVSGKFISEAKLRCIVHRNILSASYKHLLLLLSIIITSGRII